MTSDEPRSPTGWLPLLALFTAAGAMEAVFFGQLTAFIPLYLPHLGIAPADVPRWVGALAAITGGIGIPFLPLWGALADRYARQPIIVRSFLVEMLAALLMLLSGNIWVFVCARSLTSLALGNTGLMLTTLTERAPRQRVGVAFAVMNSAPPVGAFLGPLVSGPLVDAWGFRSVLLVDGLLLLVIVLALAFGYRDSFKGTNRGPLFSMAVASIRLIGRSRRLRTLFVAMFLLFSGWTLTMAYAPLVITSIYHGNEPGTAVGTIIGAGGIVALVLSPLVGMLADRFGHWRVLFIGTAIAAVLWPLPLFTRSMVSFGVAWALINGLVSSTFALSFLVLSSSTTSEVRGRVIIVPFLPMNVGFTLGPAIGSVITRGSVFAVFPTAAVLTVLGIGVLWLARRQPVETDTPVARVAEREMSI